MLLSSLHSLIVRKASFYDVFKWKKGKLIRINFIKFQMKFEKDSLCYKTTSFLHLFQAFIYLLKVNNRDTSKSCKVCLKLTTRKTQEWQELVLWASFTHFYSVSIVDFQHLNAFWVVKMFWLLLFWKSSHSKLI